MARVFAAAWPWHWSASAWSALTFLVLAVAAVVAWRQVKEARRTREEQMRPLVILDFEIVAAVFLELHVRNVGATLARDICFEFDQPLESSVRDAEWNPGDLSLFRDGIPALAPGKVIKVLFDQFVTREEKGLPRTYRVTLAYTDSFRKHHYREEMVLDLNMYVGTNGINQSGIHEVHDQLKKIATSVERWTDFHGLKIVTSEDQRRQVEEWRERHAARKAAQEGGDGQSEPVDDAI